MDAVTSPKLIDIAFKYSYSQFAFVANRNAIFDAYLVFGSENGYKSES